MFQKNKNTFVTIIAVVCLASSFIIPKDKEDTAAINFKEAFNSKIGNEIVAQVGNKKITVREFLASYEFGPAFPKRINNSKRHFLNYMINEKLIALKGYSLGLDDSSRVTELLNSIKGDLSTGEMFKDDILKNIKVTSSELAKASEEKQINYNIQWIFSPDKDSLLFFTSKIKNGISFDSLFSLQLNDSVFKDERSMEIDKFKLKDKNPELSKIMDTMKVSEISKPIKAGDGWYIFKLNDLWKNIVTTQSELAEEKADAEEVIKKQKMDHESDIYVNNLIKSESPVIKGNAFAIVRSYLGGYELSQEKFKQWKLGERLSEQIKKSNVKNNDYGYLPLVDLKDTTLSIDDFISWYRLRSQFIKLNKDDFNKFSASIENYIWQMVRDNLLMRRAYARGYQNKETVKQQLHWWKDKIVYAVMRDKIISSIKLNNNESKTNNLPKPSEKKDMEITKKILHEVLALKQKYKIKINEDLLSKIYVEDNNDPKTIDIYIVKKGGIFPHPAYPSIDMLWQNWQ